MNRREKRERMSTLRFCVIVLTLAVLLRVFVFNTIRVDGPSMQPTLWTGELVMINKIETKLSKPQRYDVVVCRFVGIEKKFIKRIVALPGETVEVREGEVYINGARLTDDVYGQGKRLSDMAVLTVPEQNVFVMGDNRSNSSDSCVYGPVPYGNIEGIAFFVVWPIGSVHFL
jgi:signal peptidase I